MRAIVSSVFVWIVALALLAAGGIARGQEVLRLTWPTKHAASGAAGSPEAAAYLAVLRASSVRMAESSLVKFALGKSSLFGVSSAEAERLGVIAERRYSLIAANPVFKDVASALPYCYSETRPSHGLALVYRPRTTNARTPILLFVHGYGGNFLWYLHQLAEWFPRHIIVCPAFGADPSSIPSAYLFECIRELNTEVGHPLARPALVGFSAGGFGVTRVYAEHPDRYRRLVVLAAYPPDDAFRAWPHTANAGWMVGAGEDYVKDGGFATYAKSLGARSAWFESRVIEGAGEFFLFTHPEQTRKTLRSWLDVASR